MANHSSKHVLILGMGKSGRSMAHFFKKRGQSVISYDDVKKENDFDGFCPIFNNIQEIDFNQIELIAFSPGVSPEHPVFKKAKEYSISVRGETEIGVRELKNYCIGVTGTNGKSTVTSLTAHILNQAGVKARAVGNIGTPLTSIVDEVDSNEVLVIELSSYQIDGLESRFLDVGIILNITPDHLDRYHTLEAYAQSKWGIQKYFKEKGSLIVSKELKESWKCFSYHTHILTYDTTFDEHAKRLEKLYHKSYAYVGPFEKQNYSAAILVCSLFNLTDEQIYQGISTYKNLPHRCEYVKTIQDVHFYNDSKGTNIESVIKAITSFNQPLIMIMGGVDKALDYSNLLPYFFNKVKEICLIGQVKEKMAEVFKKEYPVHLCQTLEEAVKKAYQRSQAKDTVLLSPGTSSFDMFNNFEHRGEEFKRIVQQLEGEPS